MKRLNIAELILNLLLRLFFGFMSLIPLRFFPFLSILIGWFLQYVIRFRRSIILDNLKIVFEEQGKASPDGIINEIYRHFGYLILEIGKLPSLSQKDILNITTVHNTELLQKAFEQKKRNYCH